MTRLLPVAMLLAAGLAATAVSARPPAAPRQDSSAVDLLRVPSAAAAHVPLQPLPATAGAVHPRALGGSLSVAGVRVAIDADDPDAAALDLLRVDLDGEGDTGRAVALPLTREPNGPITRGRFGPVRLDLVRQGRPMHLNLEGHFIEAAGRYTLWVHAMLAAEVPCAFGERTVTLRLIDATGDGRFDAPGRHATRGARRDIYPRGDVIAIEPDEPSERSHTRYYYVGQPIPVDGKWWSVQVHPDGSGATAEPVAVPQAHLHVAQDDWSLILLNGEGALLVNGGAEPVPVPAGDYRLHSYRQWARDPANGGTHQLEAGRDETMRGRSRVLRIAPDDALPLAIGTPLRASLAVTPSRQGVRFNVAAMTDSLGLRIDALTDASTGGNLAPPRVVVRGTDGDTVYVGTMEYG